LKLWVVVAVLMLSASPFVFDAPAASFAPEATGQTGARPLQTAIFDPALYRSPNPALALIRARQLGATAIRLILYWKDTAPFGTNRPVNFDATNPAHSAYIWTRIDAQVTMARAQGLEPIVGIQLAPLWAERRDRGVAGTRRPNASDLGRFATAAARRFSGTFRGLPRVRYWQVWNEPNLSLFLSPQVERKKRVSPSWYRSMVNAVARGVHSVHADNLVIAGGTAPFGRSGSANGMPPLEFMRDVLCVKGKTKLTRACRQSTTFDIWAHNPYTLGEPTRKAVGPDNVSLGDLAAMRNVLEAAVRVGNVKSNGPVQFWVTEFSWDSNPPDPKGVPVQLHMRWVAEALYRMWDAGVSLVTWFQLRDDPVGVTPFQSGLYFDEGGTYYLNKPKAAATAFRFPFVAFPDNNLVFVWGRTPGGIPSQVTIERARGNAWERVETLTSDAFGIFSARLSTTTQGVLRAKMPNGDLSVPFSLTKPEPFTLDNPFGS
jgi:hypothetical protein